MSKSKWKKNDAEGYVRSIYLTWKTDIGNKSTMWQFKNMNAVEKNCKY